MGTAPLKPGDYEIRGDSEVTGVCAGCRGDVTPGDSYVIRYSLRGDTGGIFHRSCEPTGPHWYALDSVEEAPDV